MLLVILAVTMGWWTGRKGLPPPATDHIRVVSWNLRNFPVRPGDRGSDPPHDFAGLRQTLLGLEPDVVLLQEIHEPALLARELLGPEFAWVASHDGGARSQHLVIAWRRNTLEPAGPPTEHGDVAIVPTLRPALSQPLRRRESSARSSAQASGDDVRTVATVHLKARPAGANLRIQQWERLAILGEQLADRGVAVLIAGDFNVTGGTPLADAPDADAVQPDPADERDQLERRLAQAGLQPVEVGPCTAYWHGVRHDAWMEPARLDLAFVTASEGRGRPIQGRVAAHCRTHGCTAFRDTPTDPDPSLRGLSDHCPVIIDLPWPASP